MFLTIEYILSTVISCIHLQLIGHLYVIELLPQYNWPVLGEHASLLNTISTFLFWLISRISLLVDPYMTMLGILNVSATYRMDESSPMKSPALLIIAVDSSRLVLPIKEMIFSLKNDL